MDEKTWHALGAAMNMLTDIVATEHSWNEQAKDAYTAAAAIWRIRQRVVDSAKTVTPTPTVEVGSGDCID